jgi:dihydrofolate reductase
MSNTTSQAAATIMPPPPAHPLALTLILAATPTLGIGRAGTLPWPQLRKEMAYFKRVTSRVVGGSSSGGRERCNAVVMGRKTWESIPPRFRPLEGRECGGGVGEVGGV